MMKKTLLLLSMLCSAGLQALQLPFTKQEFRQLVKKKGDKFTWQDQKKMNKELFNNAQLNSLIIAEIQNDQKLRTFLKNIYSLLHPNLTQAQIDANVSQMIQNELPNVIKQNAKRRTAAISSFSDKDLKEMFVPLNAQSEAQKFDSLIAATKRLGLTRMNDYPSYDELKKDFQGITSEKQWLGENSDKRSFSDFINEEIEVRLSDILPIIGTIQLYNYLKNMK